jgi:hypothetical protein
VSLKKTVIKKWPYTKNLNGDFCAEKEPSQNVTKKYYKIYLKEEIAT